VASGHSLAFVPGPCLRVFLWLEAVERRAASGEHPDHDPGLTQPVASPASCRSTTRSWPKASFIPPRAGAFSQLPSLFCSPIA
jgi:hypothetical protein